MKHLLSPVKPGQKVYTVSRRRVVTWTVVGVWISYDPMDSYFTVSTRSRNGFPTTHMFDFRFIDKYVFLTKKDAEKSLKAMDNMADQLLEKEAQV